MNDAYRASVVTMLKAGKTTAEIQEQLDVSVGEIAAVAETEELTQAHAKTAPAPALDLDPEIARSLAALAWGAKSSVPRTRKLAQRTLDNLSKLAELQHEEAKVKAAEAKVAAFERKLAKARAELRNIKSVSLDGETDKVTRNAIRAWARDQGLKVGTAGVIPKTVMAAWKQHTAATPSTS